MVFFASSALRLDFSWTRDFYQQVSAINMAHSNLLSERPPNHSSPSSPGNRVLFKLPIEHRQWQQHLAVRFCELSLFYDEARYEFLYLWLFICDSFLFPFHLACQYNSGWAAAAAWTPYYYDFGGAFGHLANLDHQEWTRTPRSTFSCRIITFEARCRLKIIVVRVVINAQGVDPGWPTGSDWSRWSYSAVY